MISADAFSRKKGCIGRIGAGGGFLEVGGFCVAWCGPTLIGHWKRCVVAGLTSPQSFINRCLMHLL